MCDMYGVRVGLDMHVCDTVEQLATALGVECSVVSDDPPDCCLCNAKREALGARLATNRDGWPWPRYIIDVPEHAP